MSQTMIFRGEMLLGSGQAQVVEVWKDQAAVAFQAGQPLAVLHNAEVGLTPDRRLLISGTDPDSGEPSSWTGASPEQILGRWNGSAIAWPDGESWTGVEVVWSQYGVRASAAGKATREMPGAHTEMVGAQRWIIDGTLRLAASPGARPCGCGR